MDIEKINIEKEVKIIFMGTPEFAVPILEGLINNYNVRAVVTQPDRPVGRNGQIQSSPIKQLAGKHTILVLQPEKVRDDWRQIIEFDPSLIITCAYGQLLPRELLVYPKYGCINVHASLLPKLRGGAPIHHAIIDGHSKTGVTIMHMSPKMDAGDIISQAEIPIDEKDTTASLHNKLSILGRDLLLQTLPSIIDGTAPRIKQEESEITFGLNIRPEDERIDFSKNRRQIYNQIRGLNSWPGAYCMFEGKRMKIWESYIKEDSFPTGFNGQITNLYEDGIGVKVGNGEIVFTILQPEGKSPMRAANYLNGLQNKTSLIGRIME